MHEAPISVRSQRRRLCQRGMGATPIKRKRGNAGPGRTAVLRFLTASGIACSSLWEPLTGFRRRSVRGPESIACSNLWSHGSEGYQAEKNREKIEGIGQKNAAKCPLSGEGTSPAKKFSVEGHHLNKKCPLSGREIYFSKLFSGRVAKRSKNVRWRVEKKSFSGYLTIS